MSSISGEIVINRPVEEVFDFVADERNEPRFMSTMEIRGTLTFDPVSGWTRMRWAWDLQPRGS